MNRLETFSPGALQPFVNCLVKRGIPAQRYLKQHHIPLELISSEREKIFKRQAYGFFRDVAEQEGLAGFGLLDGDSYSIDDLGMLGQATLQAATFKEGLQIFSSLLASVVEGNHLWLEEGPEISWICCLTDGLERTDYVPDHSTILVLRALVRAVAGPDWQPPLVHFYTKPLMKIERFLGSDDTRIEFLQEMTGLAFPTALLAERIDRTRPHARGLEATEDPPATVSAKLEAVIASLYKSRYPASIDLFTDVIGMSRVTLYRALAKEGTNYRLLVNRVVFKLAAELLENSDLSVNEIARELGYSTTSNFIRAFQRMSGLTPSKYRTLQK
jgi:AraC-like DNA-binding protein